MKINNFAIYNSTHINKNIPPSFKSSFRSVYSDVFCLKYNTNTCFFRKDLDWDNFADYLNQKYKNVNQVNVIDYACSTGEEPVSLAMILDTKFGNETDKFYPIKAFDIDEININQAKKNSFSINVGEMALLKNNIGDNYKKYFLECTDKNGMEGTTLYLKNKYKNHVDYSVSNILDDVHNIPSENTVLLCRNFFPYLTIGEKNKLVNQISDRLKPSSVIVLGSFDVSYGVDKLFEQCGFKHTAQYCVMEKLPDYKIIFNKLLRMLKLK